MNADWLAQLAPDRAPPPTGWWPLAPGWWGLLILVALCVPAAWWLHRRQKHTEPTAWLQAAEAALAELEGLEAAASTTPDAPPGHDAMLASQLQDLLRRVAVARYGRAEVGGLSGRAWIAFVAEHGGQAWHGEAGQALLHCAFGGVGAKASPNHRASWLNGARAFLTSAT